MDGAWNPYRKMSVVCGAIFLFFLTASLTLAEERRISTQEAHRYIGQNMTVCGFVASAKYAYRSKGQPTFLNLDAP
jgi:hypothetical protein